MCFLCCGVSTYVSCSCMHACMHACMQPCNIGFIRCGTCFCRLKLLLLVSVESLLQCEPLCLAVCSNVSPQQLLVAGNEPGLKVHLHLQALQDSD